MEDPPELSGYEPGEVRRRGAGLQRLARVVGILALAGLVLPGILIGVSTASRTAELACRVVASAAAPDASAAQARFELVGPEGPGWYCYTADFRGTETLVRFLGFIPEVRVVPGNPGTDV